MREELDRIVNEMVDKGILDMDDLVEVWKSPLIPNGPIVVRTTLDADTKAKFKDFSSGEDQCGEHFQELGEPRHRVHSITASSTTSVMKLYVR